MRGVFKHAYKCGGVLALLVLLTAPTALADGTVDEARIGHVGGTPTVDARIGHVGGEPAAEARIGTVGGTPVAEARIGPVGGAPVATTEKPSPIADFLAWLAARIGNPGG